jgi:hypothetical protein
MFRRRLLTATVLLAACWPRQHDPSADPEKGSQAVPVAAVDAPAARPTVQDAPAPAPTLTVEPGPEPDEDIVIVEDEVGRGSWRVAGFASVHAAPRPDAEELGVIAPRTRLAKRPLTQNRACPSGWLEVEPQGFVCAKLVADRRQPSKSLLPILSRGALVPGVYGQVRRAGVVYDSVEAAAAGKGQVPEAHLTVQKLGSVKVGGRSYWRTRHGLVAASAVRRFHGSRFRGVEVGGDLTLPFAWTLREKNRFSAPVYSEPAISDDPAGRVKSRRRYAIEAFSEDGEFAKLAGHGWIESSFVRVARRSDPPEGLVAGERWLDIDLDQQTLVAYEGETPVFATMVSSGKVYHRTPTGVYRIHRKVAVRTMNSMADSSTEYSVDKVPWTAYFAHGYALHAAYWHGAFGYTKSHGCVNLSPIDARRLYAWMAPVVAPGWIEVYGHETQPGSVVRIRNARDPDPPWRGYAKALADDHIEST